MSGDGLDPWLRLALTLLAPRLARELLERFGSPEAVLALGESTLRATAGEEAAQRLRQGPDPDLLQRTAAWVREPGNAALALDDPLYPALLREIPDPPLVLFCKGRTELLATPALAVVGSRSPTPQGRENAFAFAAALSTAGLTVVSGLALGIDAAAHRGGLSGPGSSVAVVATGLDLIYPSRNRELAHQLAENGLLLSEFALGTRAVAYNFPRRNRVISGLSLGCLVVEAAVDSGSLITARLAAEQGREVFAVPGSIHSPLARGYHGLIRQGAKLVETAADVLEELGWRAGPPAAQAALPALAGDAAGLLAQMGYDPVAPDVIASRLQWPAERAAAALVELEVAGWVDRLPGGLCQRRR